MKFKVTESFIRNIDFSERLQEFLNIYPFGTKKIDEGQRELMFEQLSDRLSHKLIEDIDNLTSYDFEIHIYLYEETSSRYILRHVIRDVINRYIDSVSCYDVVDQPKKSNFNLVALSDKRVAKSYWEAIQDVQVDDSFSADKKVTIVRPRDELLKRYVGFAIDEVEQMLSRN